MDFARFHITHGDYNSTLDDYVPTSEFAAALRRLLPENWEIARSGLWLHAYSTGQTTRDQGWKIHLSCTIEAESRLLEIAVPMLVEENLSFKVVLDPWSHWLLTSRGFARSQAGKFATIYPADEASFLRVGRKLAEATASIDGGAYILSDRRFEGSKVVYYRYGAFRSIKQLHLLGTKKEMITTPDGELIEDLREAYWAPPEWAHDPTPPETIEDDPEEPGLNHGRFDVVKALSFTANGGAYKALDNQSGVEVFIKEGRPRMSLGLDGSDAVERLRMEAQVLSELADLDCVPHLVALFKDWEHTFLAQEFVGGIPFARWVIKNCPLVNQTQPDRAALDSYLSQLLEVIASTAQRLHAIHERGYILGDISGLNLLLRNNSTSDPVFIDLETTRPASQQPTQIIFTPGFASKSHRQEGAQTVGADSYAICALFLFGLFPLNSGFHLSDALIVNAIRDLASAYALRDSARKMLDEGMLGGGVAVTRIVDEMRKSAPSSPRPTYQEQVPATNDAIGLALAGLEREILQSATPERADRLFPADPRAFSTNPCGLAYGAAGVLWSLNRAGAKLDPRHVSWLLQRPLGNQDIPPGIMVGQAGIAIALQDLGHAEYGLTLLKRAIKHPLGGTSNDVAYGDAGLGLALLAAYKQSSESWLLDALDPLVKGLLERAEETENGLRWQCHDGAFRPGLLRGSAGIGLFLARTAELRGDEELLEVARRALAQDLGDLVISPDTAARIDRGDGSYSPYIWDGAAGVALAVLGAGAQLPEFVPTLEALARACLYRVTALPGLMQGQAGSVLLLAQLSTRLNKPELAVSAQRQATAVLDRMVWDNDRLKALGDQGQRFSNDLATGAAGILLALSELSKVLS